MTIILMRYISFGFCYVLLVFIVYPDHNDYPDNHYDKQHYIKNIHFRRPTKD